MYHHITLKDLRPKLPQVVERVDAELDRYIISKHGEPVAVMLSIDDYESLIETVNEVTDKVALTRIRRGMKEAKRGQTISWSKVKTRYHLD